MKRKRIKIKLKKLTRGQLRMLFHTGLKQMMCEGKSIFEKNMKAMG